jgi:tyrosyl-tRNA synthetase
MTHLIEELSWREMLQDATEGAHEHLSTPGRTIYIGFDPTADSLHVGSLLPIMVLVRAQRAGHHPIALVGGATGLIGDPSFKNRERPLLGREEMEANAEGIRSQLEHFLDFDAAENPARMRNNLDWLGATGVLDFLRDVGKHFSVNAMLRKESVRRRVESEDQGISFTEFSYQLLQAADFLHLFREEGCTVQAGGSDQWGNITAGTELVRRVTGEQAFGLTSPLVTTATGTKFGKTEAGTVWLDGARTSPFRFYQFWVNCADDDVGRYLRYFTFLPREEIEELDRATRAEPYRRRAQKALAEDVTRRVHGETGLAGALKATQALFGGSLEGLSADEIADIFSEVPSSTVTRDALSGEGGGIVALLAGTSLASSRGDARRAVQGGGVYLNGERVEDVELRVTPENAVEGRFVVLRKGKKRYHLVEVV